MWQYGRNILETVLVNLTERPGFTADDIANFIKQDLERFDDNIEALKAVDNINQMLNGPATT